MKYNNPKPIPFEDMDEELCQYCEKTNYGNEAYYPTSLGLESCEGRWCGEAYDAYLEDFCNAQPDTEDEEFFRTYGITRETAKTINSMDDSIKNLLRIFGTDGTIKYLKDSENGVFTDCTINDSEESLPNSESISPMEEFFNKYNIK